MTKNDHEALAGVEAVYSRSYAGLVASVAAVCGSRQDAEEAVQDAFVRLIDQWKKVRDYDNPEAWVRRVALGKASNRHRKVRNGFRAISQLGRDAHDVPEVNANNVDLLRALAELPRPQREALVLHYFVGLDVADVARELCIPISTAKSRLSRARASLAPRLREEEFHGGL